MEKRYGLENALGREIHLEIPVKEGLLDYTMCLPAVLPGESQPKARSLVNELGKHRHGARVLCTSKVSMITILTKDSHPCFLRSVKHFLGVEDVADQTLARIFNSKLSSNSPPCHRRGPHRGSS